MMDPLLLVALAFAVVNGANDGGALLSAALRIRPAGLPLVLMGALLVALVAVPLVLGARVATTLAERLVPHRLRWHKTGKDHG